MCFKIVSYMLIALIAMNECRGALRERSEEKEAASAHFVRPKRRVPEIIGLPEGMTQAFTLLARGYHETGPCVADMGARAQEVLRSLSSPLLPTAIISIMLDYFVPPRKSQATITALKNNLWILFETYIGNPSLHCDKVVVSPAIREMFIKAFNSVGYNDPAEQDVIKLCLGDLQELAEVGQAYNPYAFVIRHQMAEDYFCHHCNTQLMFRDTDGPWFPLTTKLWSQHISQSHISRSQALINTLTTSHSVLTSCGKCETNSQVISKAILVQQPHLFMATVEDNEFSPEKELDMPTQLMRGTLAFKLCGVAMRHYYYETKEMIGNDNDFFLGGNTIKTPEKQCIVHLRGYFEPYIYHTSRCGPISHMDLKSWGGTFNTQAILYRCSDTKPYAKQQRINQRRVSPASDTTCHCIIS